MHILIIPSEKFMTKNTPLGGIFQWHQAKALANNGFQVGIISVAEIGPKMLFQKNIYNKFEMLDNIPILRNYKVSLIPPRYKSIKQNIDDNYKILKKLLDIYIKKYGKPDIVHAHNFHYAGILAQKIKENYKIPYLVTEHSTSYARGLIKDELLPFIVNSLINASVVTAVSKPFTKVLQQKLHQKNIYVLANIVENSFFQLDKNIKYKKFTFINVASLDDKKNHKLLLNSFAVSFKNKNVNLNIAGEGTLLEELKELSIMLKIDKQVKFLGRLSQKDVKIEMSKSHAFVLSSNYETFGVVLIEAMACGIPVIATKCGGPEDIVNQSNGILVEKDNKAALSDAMIKMKKNIQEYDQTIIIDDTKDRFGENAFVTNVKRYYLDILGKEK